MIEKLETNSKRGPFFMFLGQKSKNRTQIQSEDLFFRDHHTFATESVDGSRLLSYLELKSGPRHKKD